MNCIMLNVYTAGQAALQMLASDRTSGCRSAHVDFVGASRATYTGIPRRS